MLYCKAWILNTVGLQFLAYENSRDKRELAEPMEELVRELLEASGSSNGLAGGMTSPAMLGARASLSQAALGDLRVLSAVDLGKAWRDMQVRERSSDFPSRSCARHLAAWLLVLTLMVIRTVHYILYT
jgi:hypothetical protein